MKQKKVYVTLQNGDVFQGYRFGAEGEIAGEMIFSTGMVGYVETLTDPSNFGKIVVQTFPLIGNYGVARADAESEKAWVSAYIVREKCDIPSNFRLEETLEDYMKEQGIIGVYGIDTRQLTKILRENGEMNAYISNKPLKNIEDKLAGYSVKDAVKAVAPKQMQTFGDKSDYTVALWNFGAKKSTIDSLLSLGCQVISMPADSTAEEILATGANGVMIADGPGDPAENMQAIEEIKKLLGKKPVFGVGLGHQLIALALGAKTARQKYGHHGGNQPVKHVDSGKVYISTQNHSYTVLPETVKEGKVSFVGVNDSSCEGIEYAGLNALGVQFAPETCVAGTTENIVYNTFFAWMRKEKENA